MIADSIIAFQDTYDQRIYAVGKGPSATTVEAPLTAITQGSSLMIQGKVTDISPGTEEYALRARFPHGVPAVSDASQSDWMGYVYMQKERPTNTIGVNVSLSVLDSNGNTYNIGNATTDASAAYSLMWQPPILGKYTIFASFAGTNSYYPSSAETAVGVVEAPQAAPAATATPTLAPTATPTATPTASPTASPSPAPSPPGQGLGTEYYVAIAAVVIVVIIAAVAVFLRRRK
jgi:hypothetical protein